MDKMDKTGQGKRSGVVLTYAATTRMSSRPKLLDMRTRAYIRMPRMTVTMPSRTEMTMMLVGPRVSGFT